MGWIFGGWPPPPPGSGGSVTFADVRAALLTANLPVGFNNQPLQGVASVNALQLEGNNDETGISIGATGAGLPLAINRIAIGQVTLDQCQPTADDNIAIGNNSQRLATTGSSNVSLGHDTLSSLTTGFSNTALGNNAGLGLTSGQENVAVGSIAFESATAALGCVAVGYSAANVLDASNCVMVGYRAGLLATTGPNNVMVGSDAGVGVTTGQANTLIGESSGPSLTTQDNNVMVGRQAGVGSTGASQICIGASSAPADLAGASQISIGNRIYGGLNGTDYKVRIGGAGTIATQTEALQVINTGADTVPVEALSTTGTNAAKTSLYVGSADPSGAVSALGGSIYFRVSGATSGIYVNRTAGTGTSWSLVTAVP